MAKKRSIWKFTILSLLIVIGLVLSFASFPVAGTDYIYNGFLNAIPLGLDLSGGVSAVYEASLSTTSNTTDLDGAVDSTLTKLEKFLSDNGGLQSSVSKQGNNQIRIEVAKDSVSTDLLNLLGDPKTVYVASSDSFDVNDVASFTGEYISSADIENVYASYDQNSQAYGVVLDFNSKGTSKLQEMSEVASEKSENNYLYVYIGEDDPIQLTCSDPITDGQTFISGGSITDSSTAQEYAVMILSGTYSASLDLIQTSVISATVGTDALMYILIAMGVELFLIMLFMFLRYGHFGLLADVSLVVFTILNLFFLQAIPIIQLTVSGLAGIVLSYAIVVGCHVLILEKVREEYASGKKIPLSYKNAFKKALWPIFDSHVALAIVAIIMSIINISVLRSFGLILLIGAVLSMFCSLVVMRFMMKWYLPFNSTNPKPLKLKRSKYLNPDFDKPEVVEGVEDSPEKEITVTEEVGKWKSTIKTAFPLTKWLLHQNSIIAKIWSGF